MKLKKREDGKYDLVDEQGNPITKERLIEAYNKKKGGKQ